MRILVLLRNKFLDCFLKSGDFGSQFIYGR